jgi:hypothetical protein
MASKAPNTPPPAGPLTKTGKKKTIWFNWDEAEALRTAAFEQRRTESDIVRTAVREYLGIEP